MANLVKRKTGDTTHITHIAINQSILYDVSSRQIRYIGDTRHVPVLARSPDAALCHTLYSKLSAAFIRLANMDVMVCVRHVKFPPGADLLQTWCRNCRKSHEIL